MPKKFNMRIKQLFFFLILIFLLIACEKKKNDTVNPDKLEDVELLNPEIMSDGGVKLSIKINSVPNHDLYNFALVVSEDSLFTKILYTKRFELPLSIKSYSYSFSSGFRTNQKYYYSYVINNSLTSKKEIKSFVFGKEKMIQIDSIYPRNANIGDTLNVYGNFKDYHLTKVMIGDSSMSFFPRNLEQQIKVIIGPNTPTGIQTLSLLTDYQTATYKDNFSLLTPKILSLTNNVDIDQEVTIHGENFSPWPGGNTIFLNNTEVHVTTYTKNTLKFILPSSIKNVSLTLAVVTNNQRIEAPEKLNLIEPELLEAPLQLRLNQTYALKFKNLPKTKYTVKIDEHDANISHVSNQGGFQTIFFNAKGIIKYSSKRPKLIIQYLDKEITLKESIAIIDKWEPIQSTVPFEPSSFMGAVLCNNEVYIGANKQGVYTDNPMRLWKFNSSNNTFSEINVPFAIESALVTGSNNLIYVYTGTQFDNFYEYNPNTKAWKKLSNYPGLKRMGAALNTVNEKVYITGGLINYEKVYPDPDNSFYSYNIATNKWEKLADYPIYTIPLYGNRVHATALSIANSFIVVGGAKTTGNVEVMAYNTKSEQWERKADYPPLMWQTSFEHAGQGFVLKDNIHRYDLNSDKWWDVDVNVLPYGAYSHTKTTFFKHGQFAYCIFNNSASGFIRIKLADLLR